MKYLIAVTSLLVTFICSNAQTVRQKMDELLSAYAKLNKFNGSVLVAKGDDIILDKGYGYSDMANARPAGPATIYQLGSVTKQFTAAVILKLQEEKKLKVTDKLSKYFPDYPNGDKITIQNLLQHTSGIFNYTNDPVFMQTGVTQSYTSEQMMAMFRDKPLGFEPGAQYSYSNSGYMLLGYIIEKITRKPYEDAVKKYIFRPLGMSNSGFDFAALKNQNKAIGYLLYNGKNSPRAPIVDSTVSYAAGAIYSTTGDLYRWAQAIMAQKILKPESWKAGFQPNLGKYGYGWMIDSLHSRLAYFHGGGIHGFTSLISIFPEDKISIILLTNFNTDVLSELLRQLSAIAYDKPYEFPRGRSEITLDESVLKEYPGEYELAPGFILTVRYENGKLTAQATGQPSFDLFAERKDFFFLKVVDAQVEFKRDAAGNVESLILHQNGLSIPGKKK